MSVQGTGDDPCRVSVERSVERNNTRLARLDATIHRESIPRSRREPRGHRGEPPIEPLRLELVGRDRARRGLEILGIEKVSEGGIRGLPRLGRIPREILRGGEISEEERVVLDLSRLDARAVLPETECDRVLSVRVRLRSRGGNAEDEWILPRARSEVEGAPETVVRLDVEFVEDHRRGVIALCA